MIEGGGAFDGAGVVDEDVRRPFSELPRERQDCLTVSEVGGARLEGPPVRLDSLTDGAPGRFERGADSDDVGARSSESFSHGVPDAALRPGDHREATSQVEHARHAGTCAGCPACTSTRTFMALPSSRSPSADWISARGTTRVMSSLVGTTPEPMSSIAASKSVRS